MNPYQTHKTRSPWNPVRLKQVVGDQDELEPDGVHLEAAKRQL